MHTYLDTINEIKKLIILGKNNPIIKKISLLATEIKNKYKLDEFVFNEVYKLAVYKSSPNDRQQLRTIDNIIRTKKANCTGYVELIGSIFDNINRPYTIRIVDLNGNNQFTHVYIVTDNSTMDCVLNQKQDDTENFNTRLQGLFNNEIEYKNKIDFQMISILNGRLERNRRINNRNINGFFDTLLTPLLGDECKLSCNVKYPLASDEAKRQACKLACDMGMTEYQYKQWLEAGGTTIPIQNYANPYGNITNRDNTIYYIAGAVAILYLLNRK